MTAQHVGGPPELPQPEPRPTEAAASSGLSFRARLSVAFVASAILPIAGAWLLMFATGAGGSGEPGSPLDRVVLFALAAAGFFGLALALLLTSTLLAPLRAFAKAVERVSDGDLRTRLDVAGDDELGLLGDRYNRLVGDLDRRDRELREVRAEIASIDPTAGAERVAEAAAAGVRKAFEMTAAEVVLGNPDDLPITERVPGEPLPVRAVLRLGYEEFGILAGTLPATRHWEPADQMLLELFVTEIAFAIRNAELIDRVERQNARLRDLDEAKDEFLRGVGHNLQTPLTSIRGSAQQLAAERPDPRLELIDEQAGRLSRMVRQLVTVSRLDSGSVKPTADVLALGPRVSRAWDALGASGVAFEVVDEAPGWLAVADPDQVDQVLWALLDNAVRHGRGAAIAVRIAAVAAAGAAPAAGAKAAQAAGEAAGAGAAAGTPAAQLRLTVRDGGPGIPTAERHRLFGRYEQLGGQGQQGGTGLGLYVSRELCRAMGGDLVLEPEAQGSGAAFTMSLPAEPPAGE